MDKFTRLLARAVSAKAYITQSGAVYIEVTKLDGSHFIAEGVDLADASHHALAHLTRICQ